MHLLSSRSLLLAGLLFASACGGDEVATLDAAVAADLAGRADVLADQLEAGDACGARRTAGGLVTTAAEGRDAGAVPREIANEVIATTRDLVRDVTCDPDPEPSPAPAPPAADDDDTDDDDGEGRKGKGAGKGKGRDD